MVSFSSHSLAKEAPRAGFEAKRPSEADISLVPDTTIWPATVQECVTAIREAEATSQMIMLPGNDWTSAELFVSGGSLDALKNVTNLDGTTTNLVFDVHKYLHEDNSGTYEECVTDNIDSSFAPLATALRDIGRQAILSETGGENVEFCVQYVCQQLDYLNTNEDVYLGYVGWSAGAFQRDWNYILTLVPTLEGGSWSDTLLAESCFQRWLADHSDTEEGGSGYCYLLTGWLVRGSEWYQEGI